MASQFDDVQYNELIVDNACMQLVMRPETFDVIVLPNLYGDIVSDLCAGLVGGLGVVPGANIGAQYAVYEPVHGSAPKYAGQNKVNPMAMMFSGVLMLRHIGERAMADRIMDALGRVLAEDKVRTQDLGGTATTKEFADAISKRL